MKTSKSLTVALALAAAVVLLSFSIAVPILCRPFYYAHIDPLELEEQTGLTRDEIKAAYNEMLDYCLGGGEFSTGVLRWSEAGKAHFTDVRVLFLLDLKVLLGSVLFLAALLVGAWMGKLRPPRWRGAVRSFGQVSGWRRFFFLRGDWPRWTLTEPSSSSTPCSFRGRTTGCLIPVSIRSSPSCPNSFS